MSYQPHSVAASFQATVGGGRRPLAASDFTYLGGFRLPAGTVTVTDGPAASWRVLAGVTDNVAPTRDVLTLAPQETVLVNRYNYNSGQGDKHSVQMLTGAAAGKSYAVESYNNTTRAASLTFPIGTPVPAPGDAYSLYYSFSPGGNGGGLAVRKVGGAVRLFVSSAVGSRVLCELSIPPDGQFVADPSGASFARAAFLSARAEPYFGSLATNDSRQWLYAQGPPYARESMFWDERSSRVYWSYAQDYTTNTTTPALAAVTLDDAGPPAFAGPFRVTGVPAKSLQHGVLAVPQAFADAYLGANGNPFVGFLGGGYYSLFAQGGGSNGPNLYALPQPPAAAYSPAIGAVDAGASDVPYLSATPLLRHLYAENHGRRTPGFVGRNYYRRKAGGPCKGATSTTLTLWMGSGTLNSGAFVGHDVLITSGAGTGQVGRVTAAGTNGGSVVTLTTPWAVTPAVNDTYEIASPIAVTAASDSSMTLSATLAATLEGTPNPYVRMVTGAAAGQDERTLTLASGTTYSVSPPWGSLPGESGVPATGDRFRQYPGGYGQQRPGDQSPGWENFGVQVGGVAWIDGANKHGLLVVAAGAHGEGWYDQSNLRARGHDQFWCVYDPDDLALVAQGSLSPDGLIPQVFVPSWSGGSGYPGKPSPDVPASPYAIMGTPYARAVTGMAYEPTDRRLYLLVGGNVLVYAVNC